MIHILVSDCKSINISIKYILFKVFYCDHEILTFKNLTEIFVTKSISLKADMLFIYVYIFMYI